MVESFVLFGDRERWILFVTATLLGAFHPNVVACPFTNEALVCWMFRELLLFGLVILQEIVLCFLSQTNFVFDVFKFEFFTFFEELLDFMSH